MNTATTIFRYLILFLMLGALSYQHSVIHEQQVLIQQMTSNPACMNAPLN
jgi:hypothetical protein